MRGAIPLVLGCLVGCGPSTEDLQSIRFAPLSGGDWEVSTPEDQALNPTLLKSLFYEAKDTVGASGRSTLRHGTWPSSGNSFWTAASMMGRRS